MRRLRQSFIGIVVLASVTTLLSLSSQSMMWTLQGYYLSMGGGGGGGGGSDRGVLQDDATRAPPLVVVDSNVWYHEDEEKARRKVPDPKSFFNIITRIGGNEWTTPRYGEILDPGGLKLVEIASQVGAAHLVRPVSPLPQQHPPKVDIDCSNPTYSRVLTGRKDPHQKIIIDATIFGWDVDLLEIRLLEIADLVHKVVVGEQNANFKGVFKPYFVVPKLMQDRLASFVSKVDYVPQTISHPIIAKIRSNPSKYQWYLESAIRNQTIHRVLQQYAHLQSNNNNTRVYVIQNDGDEIPGRTALAHFKDCELSKPDSLTLFPSFHYKRNVAYLQKVSNFKDAKLKGSQKRNPIYKYLRNFVWTNGPTIVPFGEIHPAIFRYAFAGGKKINMGLGSASHFSNPAHSILGFLKLGSTSDSGLAKMTPQFYANARAGTITNLEIRNISYMCQTANDPNHPWMALWDMEKESNKQDNGKSKHKDKHKNKNKNKNTTTIEQVLYQHLPWAVRSFGQERYPWLYRQDIVKEEEQVNNCLCCGRCGDVSPHSTIFFGS